MSLRLYNTFAKREEEFVPRRKGRVSLYTCGPTVYGRPHIGNYSSFLMADLLRRWLEVSGYSVTHVKNITDVGHLVADADSGEDKVEREAKKEKVNPLEIARKYTEMYLEDEKALNMIEPEHRPRASEYVPQMIDIIKTLVEKKHAYETADGIYFSVESFPEYGKLSGNTLENLNAGSRIALDEDKKHPADFALWKKCVGENAHHILRWPSPWGEGFPGWHIECSAMSSALLGPEIDIHTGGEDNIFPHHECEIAQSECCTGNHPFVRIWLHKRRIDLLGEKMSKSLGNVLTIPDVIAKGFSALDVRFAFLSVHYRTNLKFSFDALENARKVRLKIVEWFETVTTESADAVSDAERGIDPKISEAIESFSAAMNSDLNTAGALGSLFTVMNYYYAVRTNKTLPSREDFHELLSFIETARRTFGCFESESLEIPAQVQALLNQRGKARASKDFAESDRLRDEIKNLGFEVRDTGTEQTLKKI